MYYYYYTHLLYIIIIDFIIITIIIIIIDFIIITIFIGGTPAFLQTIKAALAYKLKEKMGVQNIFQRERQIVQLVFEKLGNHPSIHILAGDQQDRLPIFSFCITDLHYNLGVRMLNDYFGIQTRGGCSCAGTYGHYLLHVNPAYSSKISLKVHSGDLSSKPGWIRVSFHPTSTNKEVEFVCDGIIALADNHLLWSKEYDCDLVNSHFSRKASNNSLQKQLLTQWFN